MKNIIFIAPPAAGKGTQSDKLVQKYGYNHISTGDLLREEVATGSELGNRINEIMVSGGLVDDSIVTELLKKELSKNDNGFILDGYPRNISQANNLDNLLKELHKKIDVVLYLDMDIKTAMERALGRLVCSKCGKSYHKTNELLKSKIDGICDDCDSPLISRSDDNEVTFTSRFESYVNNTKPLLDYYDSIGILNVVDNSGTPDSTFELIERVID